MRDNLGDINLKHDNDAYKQGSYIRDLERENEQLKKEIELLKNSCKEKVHLSDISQTEDYFFYIKEQIRTCFGSFPIPILIIDLSGIIKLVINNIDEVEFDIPENYFIDQSFNALFQTCDDNELPMNDWIQRIKSREIIKGFNLKGIDKLCNTFYRMYCAPLSSVAGEIIGGLIILFNITENKNSEKALLANEEKFRLLSSYALDPIIMIDSEDKILFWNEAAESILGYTSDEVIGKEVHPLLSSSSNDNYKVEFKQFNASGKTRFDGKTLEITVKKKNGSLFPAELSISTVKIHGKWNAVGILRDITVRDKEKNILKQSHDKYRELSKQLQKALDKAQEVDRLKSAFLANMSHEIRTPLNAINGFVDLMLMDEQCPPAFKDNLQYVKLSGKSLLNIIDNILELSKLEAGQVEVEVLEVPLEAILSNVFSLTEDPTKSLHNIEINLHIDPLIQDYILTDPDKLIRILTHLMENAIKFTDKGCIEYGVKLKNKKTLLFYFKDTGIGIDKEKIPLIFNAFEQGNIDITREYGGTGLGLTITKRLVELLGGQIKVSSKKNIGSYFSFTLPYHPVIEGDNTQTKKDNLNQKVYSSLAHKSFNNRTNTPIILIVEDEPRNQQMISNMLEKMGFTILKANNGEEAIDRYTNHPEIDLVLMDIKMPIIDGFEAKSHIRKIEKEKQRRSIPIIALTAYSMEGDKKKGIAAGFDSYLTKPINIDELIETLNHHLYPA